MNLNFPLNPNINDTYQYGGSPTYIWNGARWVVIHSTSGNSGISGTAGTSGTSGTSITWQGNWDSGTQYYTNDLVQYGGSEYIALVNTLGNQPNLFQDWAYFVVGGTAGTSGTSGATGTSGTAGTSGATGTSGTAGTSIVVPGSNNQLLTSNGLGGMVAESDVTFDGTYLSAPYLSATYSNGDEGGEIRLAQAQTNSTLSGGTTVDMYKNSLRIFEQGGNARGVSIDLSKAPTSVGAELFWKVSGLVNAGTFVQMDNLKVTVTTSGQRGLSVAAVTGSFTCHISGWYAYSGSSGTQAENVTYTTTPSGSVFGWSFGAAGCTAQYHILDNTNSRFYRITMMIGVSYINNFLSIERLY